MHSAASNSPSLTNLSQHFICKTPKSRKGETIAKDRAPALHSRNKCNHSYPYFFLTIVYSYCPVPSSLKQFWWKEWEELTPKWLIQGQYRQKSSSSHSSRQMEAQRHQWTPRTGSWDKACTSMLVTLFLRLVLITELLGDVVARALVFRLKLTICMKRNWQ